MICEFVEFYCSVLRSQSADFLEASLVCIENILSELDCTDCVIDLFVIVYDDQLAITNKESYRVFRIVTLPAH